jgi:arylsulfatase
MDQGVGRVLAKLGEIGAAPNTLVLFLADNGACHEVINRGTPGVPAGGADSFFSYGVAWANAGNTPFRMYKHWVHEGGIASPLIAYWPAVIRTPGITHQVGHVVDLMATFVELAGADYPKSFNGNAVLPTEGRSLAPVFEGKVRPDRGAIYWEHEGNKAILEGDWKLVAKYRGDWELYNLSDDRTETRDLAAERPGKVKELRGLWTAWAQRVGVVPWEQLTKTKKKAGG